MSEDEFRAYIDLCFYRIEKAAEEAKLPDDMKSYWKERIDQELDICRRNRDTMM